MKRIARRIGLAATTASTLLVLSACTPAVTQYWLLSDDGDLSTAWCHNRTIEALTVTFVANKTEDSLASQSYTVEGPPLFVPKGQVVSLSKVAPGWTTPPAVDLDADWYAIEIDSTNRTTAEFAGRVERVELTSDDWVASPAPGPFVESCELLD